MTYALAWRVVAQSVDPEHGVEEARIFTTVLMVTAPCAAPTSNRHQNQVARQRAAASLCAASRASLTAPCVRIVAADSREVDRHHHSRRHRGGERHLVGWLRDSRRLSAPHARKRAASGGCQVLSSCKAAVNVAASARFHRSLCRPARVDSPRICGDSDGGCISCFRSLPLFFML